MDAKKEEICDWNGDDERERESERATGFSYRRVEVDIEVNQ